MSDDHFLRRWSRKKHEARARQQDVVPASPGIPAPSGVIPAAPGIISAQAEIQSPPAETKPLPAIESLTPDSDFTPFMGERVDPALKRAALKTLFRDPRFNVMDGLDVYIDDYSKPDPLPEGWLEKMNQVARLGDYRPPEAAEEATDPLEAAGKVEPEQAVVLAPPEPSLDTSTPGSLPPKSKES